MAVVDIRRYNSYHGLDPIPADFDRFWVDRMVEADQTALRYEVAPSRIPSFATCEFLDLWFEGFKGEKLYARFVKPLKEGPLPVVLQFHGYASSSRSWLAQSTYAGMGCALIALDNPGQGGRSQDTGGFLGSTVAGHLVAGADGPAKDQYYVRLYQNVRILCRIIAEMGEFDLSKVMVSGASQGGAMALACCALNPGFVRRAAILYPFLSDFHRVFLDGADEGAYEGLRYWSRHFDPDGRRQNELFGKLAYFDTKNFAHLVDCEVLFGTALSDTVCPPVTQCAVYNELRCEKRRVTFPQFGHEEIQAFDDELLRFFGEVVSDHAE